MRLHGYDDSTKVINKKVYILGMLKVVEATNVSTKSKNNYKTREKNQRLLALAKL